MDWLNYHHLFYFHVIRQEAGLSRAAKRLHLTHSTLSKQLRALETSLGGELFERRGKRLIPTPLGDEVSAYAAEIFHIGNELMETSRARAIGGRSGLRVGVVSAIPKSIVYQLLEPALGRGTLQIRQDRLDTLLEELAANRLNLVLSDTPHVSASGQRFHSQPLGQTEVLLYGVPKLVRRYRRRFPNSLEGAPLVLPSRGTSMRAAIDRYLAERAIQPEVRAEIDDAGLVRTFGQFGFGLFPVRETLRSELDLHGISMVGRLEGVHESYYVLSVERAIRHEAVQLVIANARSRLGQPALEARRRAAPSRQRR